MSDLVVVPTPLRQSRVRRRLCDAQGGVLLGPRVTTLRGLVPGLLAAAGERRALLTPLAERIVALGAARASSLVAAGDAGGGSRAAASLLAELRAAELSPADLRGAAAAAAGRVAERLESAARALSVHEERLRDLRALDAAGALRAAADAAARGAASEETRDVGLLVLEGLLPSSRAALDLGGALASRARGVLARVPFLPEAAARSGPAEPWVRRIESLHELAATRDLRVEFPVSGAVGVARALRMPAPDDEGQAAAAARLAGSLFDDGMAAGDIAVFAPPRILDLLPEAFAKVGVPLAAPVARPLAEIPLVRDLRSALAAAGGLDRAAAEALLASPFLRAGEGGRFRHLLDRAGAVGGRGDPEARLRERARGLSGAGIAGGERRALLGVADEMRALRRSLSLLAGEARPEQWAARLRTFVDRAGIRRRAGRGDPALARRDLAALARLEDLLDELASALRVAGRGEAIGRAEYLSYLDLALGSCELPAGQGPAAGAVEAWPLEEAPGLAPRAAIVLGAGRGTWPAPPRVDSLLGNAAREAVQAFARRRALATAASRHAEAELRGWSALTAPSDLLAVAWTSGPDGEGPAALAREALEVAGAEERDLARDPPLAAARGASEAVRAAARLAGGGLGSEVVGWLADAPDLAARAASAAARGRQEVERREAWVAGEAVASAGRIPAELAPAWAAALPAEWSATDLETFAACPYRYLLAKAGVREPGTAGLDIEPRDEGALLHAVLEVVVRVRRDRGAWPPRGDAADREEARALAAPVLDRFETEGRVGDPATWAPRREAILLRVDRFVEAEAAHADGLAPALVEHGFGGRSGRPPLSIQGPEGEVLLQGRIDRVDADGERLLVIDYKNARSSQRARERLSPDELGVTSFQAPVYLLAAARELPGRTRLAATYSLLRSGERVDPWTVPAGDPFLALDPARRAEVRAAGGRTLADAVVEVVGRIRSGALPVAPRDCTYCPYGAVCRFPRAGEA